MLSYILKLQCLFVCLSVRPGPETHIPKKTHTFSFQVSRNEGPVRLGTWGRGRAGQGGQGRAGAGAVFLTNRGRGRGSLSVCLTNKGRGRAGQGTVFSYACIYKQTK